MECCFCHKSRSSLMGPFESRSAQFRAHSSLLSPPIAGASGSVTGLTLGSYWQGMGKHNKMACAQELPGSENVYSHPWAGLGSALRPTPGGGLSQRSSQRSHTFVEHQGWILGALPHSLLAWPLPQDPQPGCPLLLRWRGTWPLAVPGAVSEGG